MSTKPPMRAFKQEKLWRDKMPNFCRSEGSIVTTKTLSDPEFDHELRSKFIEEADEVRTAASREELVEELADIYEVIDALCSLHAISKEEIVTIQHKKRTEKGGFEQRAYVTIVQHLAGSYSESYCLSQPHKYPEIQNISHEKLDK